MLLRPYLNGKNLALFSFTRPLPWSSVGRMQYAPTRVPEKMAIFFCTGQKRTENLMNFRPSG